MELYIGLFTLAVISAIECANSIIKEKNDFPPMVAFICGKPAMHLTEKGWIRDDTVNCLYEPVEILNYCRSVYPEKDITNIVDSSETVTIGGWCKTNKKHCKKHSTHTVRPYRCLEGPFQSDALLVPEHCLFDHEHENKVCRTFIQWNQTSLSACQAKNMVQQSFAMLLPCGIDMFSGVEFVCCPRSQTETPTMEIMNTRSTTTTTTTSSPQDIEIISDEEDDDDDYYDYYDSDKDSNDVPHTEEDDDDEYEYDEDEEDETEDTQEIHELQTEPQPRDPYEEYLHKPSSLFNEHQAFQRAKGELQKHHHEKVTKMMKEWATARQHVQEMRRADPKAADKLNREITARFQKTYEALEQEGVAERGQLSGLHQQRVQSQLNDKKRFSMEHYMATLQDANPQSSQILKALQHYIKTEQKDRMHTINHYEHIRDTAPEQAGHVRQLAMDHLAIIDQRIEQAIQMLNRVPEYSKKIQLQIEDFMKSFHEIDVSIANLMSQPVQDIAADVELPADVDEKDDDDVVQEIDNMDNMDEDEDIQKQVVQEFQNVDMEEIETVDDELDEEEDINNAGDQEIPVEHVPLMQDNQMNPTRYDDEEFEDEHSYIEINQPQISHQSVDNFVAKSNYIHREKMSSLSSSAGNSLGIAIGCIVVFVVLSVGALVLRRRTQKSNNQGFVEVDQAAMGASPEERHVTNMQMNGYENPTYKFFEMNNTNGNNTANGNSNA